MEQFVYNSPEFKKHLKESQHEMAEVKFMKSIARRGMTAIDVGGNKGVTAVTIAKSIGRKGKLFSFEPVPEYLRKLKRNISLNKIRNTEVYWLVLSNKVFTTNFYKDGGSSSIIAKKGVKKLKVGTTTIDMFLSQRNIRKIDLLNMDCEGSELLVLKGAKETLQRSKVRIFCEIHKEFLKRLNHSVKDIVKYLNKLGFKVYNVRLKDLKLGNNFKECEYIYAKK